ncbi:hypothetical protein ABZX92_41155 [Lentzea sp. NPDC006480]|uniref:hypothetical protein n=1 Tax=Lentzea sp. NPDC006480 TaxID=3157176 RepID=UPI0033A55A3D
MSSDFTVDHAGTWYGPTWNASYGLFSWVLERIAAHTADSTVAQAMREHLADHDGMFFLTWYSEQQAAEIVRVITGPLREDLPGETESVRTRVAELIALAKGWAEATDVFPLSLPWKFARQESGEVVRYHTGDRPLDIVFDGVHDAELPEELDHPEIGLADGGYAVSAVGFGAVVPAEGLRLLGDPYNGPLEHRIQQPQRIAMAVHAGQSGEPEWMMEAEIVGRDARLTLSRSELVLMLSVITVLDNTMKSDLAYQDMVGRSREEVWEYAKQFSELAKAIPYEPPVH